MTAETRRRLLLLAVVVAGIAAAFYWREQLSIEVLTLRVGQLGWLAPLVFIACYAAGAVLFLPGLVFTLAGGILFGPLYGTLYNLMDVLIRKGYVTSKKSDPTPVQGGRSKTIYSITRQGRKALRETLMLHEQISKSLPGLETGR